MIKWLIIIFEAVHKKYLSPSAVYNNNRKILCFALWFHGENRIIQNTHLETCLP